MHLSTLLYILCKAAFPKCRFLEPSGSKKKMTKLEQKIKITAHLLQAKTYAKFWIWTFLWCLYWNSPLPHNPSSRLVTTPIIIIMDYNIHIVYVCNVYLSVKLTAVTLSTPKSCVHHIIRKTKQKVGDVIVWQVTGIFKKYQCRSINKYRWYMM